MRKLWIVLIFTISCLGLKAQELFIGASYGVSGYSGDLVPGSIDVLELNKSYGLQLRLDLGKLISIRTGVQRMRLSGNDLNYSSLVPYLERGLSFQNDLWEANAILEVNFLRFGTKRTLSAAFLFGGFSAYRNSFQIQKDGIPIQELSRVLFNDHILRVDPGTGTGNGSVSYPAGIGFKIFPSAKSCLEFRTGLRLGGGDALDGVTYEGPVSTADHDSAPLPGGFLKKNDLYFFTGVAVSIRPF